MCRRIGEIAVDRIGGAALTGAETVGDAAGGEEADETAGDGTAAAGHKNGHGWFLIPEQVGQTLG